MGPLTARRRWWLIARGILRALVTSVVVVALYYVLPLDRRSGSYVFVELVIGVALLAGMITWQVEAIVRSDYPGIRAVQALPSTTPVFLLPHALEVSADRYGPIVVAFTYLACLYTASFCFLATTLVGQVIATDQGSLGGWIRRGHRVQAPAGAIDAR
jgi:hypothetical protein